MIFVLCSSQIREMALKVDFCVVLFVVMFGCMQVPGSATTTYSPLNTTTTTAKNNGGNGNSVNLNGNGGNQITNSTISTSSNGSMNNTTPSSSKNNTTQNPKEASFGALTGSSSDSSVTSCFKLPLLAFMTLSFLQMIQWPSTSLLLWRQTIMWDSLET